MRHCGLAPFRPRLAGMPGPDVALGRFDRALRRNGFPIVVGVDEVGRGSLAGPVVAAAVLLADGVRLRGLDDSKRLGREEREVQAAAIRQCALAIGYAFVGPRRIDAVNIRQASLTAMRRSVRRLVARARGAAEQPLVLIDGIDVIPDAPWSQRTVIGGDARSLSIAAASVIAKTLRDGFMTRLGAEYPHYGFERHKGYGTEEHLAAIDEHGPCRWHRYSYAPVAQISLFRTALV